MFEVGDIVSFTTRYGNIGTTSCWIVVYVHASNLNHRYDVLSIPSPSRLIRFQSLSTCEFSRRSTEEEKLMISEWLIINEKTK